MSLKKNFDKLKKKGQEYFELEKERENLDLKIKDLKNRYKEGDVDKRAFSNQNKQLLDFDFRIKSKKKEISKINIKLNNDLDEEMESVFG